MKIKNIISILGVVSFGLSLQSCQDFLTETNPNYLSTDTYFTTVAECSAGLNAVYNSYMDVNNHTGASSENLRTDMAVQGSSSRSTFTNEAYLQNFSDSFSSSASKWANIYEGIFRANQVIRAVDALEGSLKLETQIEEANLVKAQALFMRGLFYFWLSTTFNHGEVAYIDQVAESEKDYYSKTLPKDRIIAYYREDLNKAIELGLPGSWEGPDVGRVTSWAAKAVLGKSYLYEENYEMARKYFKEIIDSGQFRLMDNIGDNFTSDNEFNAESILEVNYSTSYNSEFGAWSGACQYNMMGMTFSKKGWTSIVVPFWLVEEYTDFELVDRNNPENWVAMEYDNYSYSNSELYKDVIYTQNGKRFGDEYTATLNDAEVTYKIDYVYCNTGLEGAAYAQNIYKRTIIIDNETGELVPAGGSVTANPLYDDQLPSAEYNPLIDRLTIEWMGGTPMRLRRFTPRASYSVVINSDEELSCYTRTNNQACAFHNSESGYFRKHTNWDKWEEEEDNPVQATASEINFRFIRYADILLLYAESLIEGGTNNSGYAEAMMYVNRVRERAGAVLIGSETTPMAEFVGQRSYQDTVVDTATGDTADGMNPFVHDAATLMTHLMYKERPLELSVEGNAIRAIDLLRWGVTKERLQYLAQQKYIFTQMNYLTYPTEDKFDTEVDETKIFTVGSNWCWQKRADFDPEAQSFADFEQAAVNYNDKVAYWPIPNTETSSNPFITD